MVYGNVTVFRRKTALSLKRGKTERQLVLITYIKTYELSTAGKIVDLE